METVFINYMNKAYRLKYRNLTEKQNFLNPRNMVTGSDTEESFGYDIVGVLKKYLCR